MISCPTRVDRTRRIWRAYLPYKFFIFTFCIFGTSSPTTPRCFVSPLGGVSVHLCFTSLQFRAYQPCVKPPCDTTIVLRFISTRSLHVLLCLPRLSQQSTDSGTRRVFGAYRLEYLKTCDRMGLGAATRGLQLLLSGSRRSSTFVGVDWHPALLLI